MGVYEHAQRLIEVLDDLSHRAALGVPGESAFDPPGISQVRAMWRAAQRLILGSRQGLLPSSAHPARDDPIGAATQQGHRCADA
jgi:hypothetical protein